jgi:hypothetical protein
MAGSWTEGRRGQTFALALLLVAVALFWLGVAAPLREAYTEQAELLERKVMLLRRMAGLVATLPELQRAAAELPPDAAPGAALLAGATDALAGAALQQMLQALVAQQPGVSVSSLETLPTEAVAHYRRIGLRVVGAAPWPQLLALFQAIGQATPRLAIDAISLRAPPPHLARAGVQAPIEASFTVYAFRGAAG